MPTKRPRIMITLSSGLMRALEWWADKEGNRPTTIAVFLVEQFVRKQIEAGLIPAEVLIEPDPDAEPEQLKQPGALAVGAKAGLENFLKMVAKGECPEDADLVRLADALDIDPDLLVELCPDVRKEETPNGV